MARQLLELCPDKDPNSEAGKKLVVCPCPAFTLTTTTLQNLIMSECRERPAEKQLISLYTLELLAQGTFLYHCC